jgi:DNA primase
VTQGIADETVRRYYREDFRTRLSQFLSAPAANSNQPWRRGERAKQQPGRFQRRAETPGRNGPYVVVSQQLANSPVHRGYRTALPRREALILQAALNHPWLLHDHLEELASLEFRHVDAERLKSALIDVAAHAASLDAAELKAELEARGLSQAVERVTAAITTASVWGAREEAAPDDVLVTWGQLIGLHRQWHSLLKELKDAEQALGEDASEANYLRLRDVKGRLEKMDGMEALIEGFGASSGRGSRAL